MQVVTFESEFTSFMLPYPTRYLTVKNTTKIYLGSYEKKLAYVTPITVFSVTYSNLRCM